VIESKSKKPPNPEEFERLAAAISESARVPGAPFQVYTTVKSKFGQKLVEEIRPLADGFHQLSL
jgi:hypothetical protein